MLTKWICPKLLNYTGYINEWMRKKKGYFYTKNMPTVKMVEQWKYLLVLKIEKYKHIHGRNDMNLSKTEEIN